jgi:RNA polymerase sigma-70 factor (ECF subfamily)
VVRGPSEPPFGADQRQALEQAAAQMKSGDFDAKELADYVLSNRDAPDQDQEGLHVWEVLTVDVVEGRIQTVRIVRNPDKLGHV